MIEITDEKFDEAFNKADQTVKALMYSSRISDSAAKLLGGDIATINPNRIVLPIGYYLLGLITTDQTIAELDGLGVKNSMVFLGEIKKILSEAPLENSASVTLNSDGTTPDKVPNNPYATQDADGTSVYQTSQDAVLNPVPQNPNPPTDTPKWGQM